MVKEDVLLERVLQFMSVAILCFALTYVYSAEAQYSGSECHTLTAGSRVPSSYGVPWDLFAPERELFMRVVCEEDASAKVYLGNGDPGYFIYSIGYQKINGSWERVNFSGSQKVGPWFVGEAVGNLDGVERGELGQVIAYVCKKANGVWKCGCSDTQCVTPKWQLQRFSPEETDTNEQTDENLDSLDVYYPSTHTALPGSTVTLYGHGFSRQSNEVLWDGEETQRVSSGDGTTVQIQVPRIAPGKYEVYVRRNGETSEYPAIIWVLENSGGAPVITHITPDSIAQGDEITVHGSGFTEAFNDAITTFGVIEGLVSEDGNSITFPYDPFEEEQAFYYEDGRTKREIIQEIHVTIVNTHGTSNTETFTIVF